MKIIWITGGATGIGFATAKKFLDNQWKVIISSRNLEKLKKAKIELINFLEKLDEKNLYLRGLISFIGFKQKGLNYERKKRFT